LFPMEQVPEGGCQKQVRFMERGQAHSSLAMAQGQELAWGKPHPPHRVEERPRHPGACLFSGISQGEAEH